MIEESSSVSGFWGVALGHQVLFAVPDGEMGATFPLNPPVVVVA